MMTSTVPGRIPRLIACVLIAMVPVLALLAGPFACAADQPAAAAKVAVDEKAGTITVLAAVSAVAAKEPAATAKEGVPGVAKEEVPGGADGMTRLPNASANVGRFFTSDATALEIRQALAKLKLEPGAAVTITVRRAAPAVRRVHVFISGRVQGVGFRDFTQRSASKLGLTGWVKNLADGRVEAVIEGDAKQVAALLELLKRGPEAARVDKQDVTDEAPKGDAKDFTVLR